MNANWKRHFASVVRDTERLLCEKKKANLLKSNVDNNMRLAPQSARGEGRTSPKSYTGAD